MKKVLFLLCLSGVCYGVFANDDGNIRSSYDRNLRDSYGECVHDKYYDKGHAGSSCNKVSVASQPKNSGGTGSAAKAVPDAVVKQQ